MKTLWQVSFVILAAMIACDDEDEDDPTPENPADMPYMLTIDPANFETSNITGNDFFPLASGKVFTYEGESEDGTSVRVVTHWTTDTRMIAGVTCVITHDLEYEDDELSEEEIINAIQHLAPSYRMVFNLFVMEGFHHGEIANLLNISVGTSKSNLAVARNKLQRMLLASNQENLNKEKNG